MNGTRSLRFRPDIEGLRAIAILLVVMYHLRTSVFQGGYVGVDVFFVLSGYLITSLLLAELESTGKLNLVAFYSRRARRLLPGLALVVLIVIPVSFLVYAPLEHRQLAATAGSTATYASNLYFALRSTDYLAGDARANPLLHTWSLSVEEQFYLVWPVLVMLGFKLGWGTASSRARVRLLSWMIAAGVISLASSVLLTSTRQPWAFFLAPTRGWEFAIGAIAVLLRPNLVGNRLTDEISSWVGVALIFTSAWAFRETTSFPGVVALAPAIGTALVIHGTTNPSTGVARTLSLQPFQQVGRLSYSWYLWHWPLLVIAGALFGTLSLVVRVGIIAVSLLVAEMSYRLVEDPIRHSAKLARVRWRSLLMAASIAGIGLALSLTWWAASVRLAHRPPQQRFAEARTDLPIIYDNGCHASVYETHVADCAFGSARGSQTAVLLGDSHAAQWFPALERISRGLGWRLVVMTKSSCPAVEGPEVRLENRINVECPIWRRHALDRIGEMRPALVVVSSLATGYGFTDGEWLQGTRRLLAELSTASQHVVLVRDTPTPGFDVPVCLARQAWRADVLPSTPCAFNSFESSWPGVFAAQQQAAAGFDNVRTLDLLDSICPRGACPLEGHGYVYYRDWHHITKRFSESLAAPFAVGIGVGQSSQLSASDR